MNRCIYFANQLFKTTSPVKLVINPVIYISLERIKPDTFVLVNNIINTKDIENSLLRDICHMMPAMDGKITGLFTDTDVTERVGEKYKWQMKYIACRNDLVGG